MSSIPKQPDSRNIALVILAAGASSRLGRPKQLVRKDNQTLIERVLHTAVNTPCFPIMVVLGAYREELIPLLSGWPVQIVENPDWDQGMGTSISCSLQTLIDQYPQTESVILLVCDQPYLQTEHLEALITAWESTGSGIIASRYDDILGVPALYASVYFSELAALDGPTGARKLIMKYTNDVSFVDFPKGRITWTQNRMSKNSFRTEFIRWFPKWPWPGYLPPLRS